MPIDRLIRFVIGPGDVIFPDIARRLPGRGYWVTADSGALNGAISKKAFARAARQAVEVPPDLMDRTVALLTDRLVSIVALARRAGSAVAGFEKVRAFLGDRQAGVLIEAADAAGDGHSKMVRLADATGTPMISALDRGALGAPFDRGQAVHVALAGGRLADEAWLVAGQLEGFGQARLHRRDDELNNGNRGQRVGASPGTEQPGTTVRNT